MRITLKIDDDVHASLKNIAGRCGLSMGKMASELIRSELAASKSEVRVRNGIRLCNSRPGGTARVSAKLVK